jgi:polyhydroxyalkanoate synthase subunit PhaC
MSRKAISKDEKRNSTPDARDSRPAMPAAPPKTAAAERVSSMGERMVALAGFGLAANPASQWLMAPGNASPPSVDLVARMLDQNPILSSVGTMWNANPFHDIVPVDWAEVLRALRTVWLRSAADPARTFQAAVDLNMQMWTSAIETWNSFSARWPGMSGKPAEPRQRTADKRFEAPEWQANPLYRTIKDMYLLASDFLLKQGEASDLEPAERERLRFHLQQFVNAASPTLFLLSNPAALHRMMETGGTSLVDGARNLMNDLKEGRLSMVDPTAFAPGRNLATTPGKVIYRNRLIELIQYTPETEQIYAVPLLFIPPWINKYYILDMQPKNSFVRYLVEQGFSVFVISWKNPDASMEELTFEDYMRDGLLEASDVAREITGSPSVNPVGYCIGGTLLAMTLAYLAAKGDRRFGAPTFMVSLQDYARVGETALFMGEPAIDFVEQQMMERGYLDSREMANMFSLLRSNDLIWSNVVNNYLMGNPPPAFDLLYWNSDGTRMARAAHSWYLRNTYVENNLIKPGHIVLMDEPIDLGRITQDIYAVGAEGDHIVPWYAAWRITQLVGGRVRFVMASSGHIAGIINPVASKKGAYWVDETGRPAPGPEEWRERAERHEGSWWTDWTAWLGERSGELSGARAAGSELHPPMIDAPGTYVLEK